jgi:hypothetical protein
MKKLALGTALAAVGLISSPAWAESTYVTPAVVGSAAAARLDFSIVVPQVLFLRVGTSAGNTVTDGTINAISFTPAAANIGNGVAVAGVGGDIGAGAVTVRVFGNGGNISLNSATTGPMANVAGQTIPWTEIGVVAAALAVPTAGYTVGAVVHPTFNPAALGGNGTATALAAAANVVRVEGSWTYRYLNTNVVGAGTYGTAARAGRVTYTATQL